MARKGYAAEAMAKKELVKDYGELNVIKVAIGGAQDFIAIQNGRLSKVIEVKECHQPKYYPSFREIQQLERMLSFVKEHNTQLELWIRYPKKRLWDKQIKY